MKEAVITHAEEQDQDLRTREGASVMEVGNYTYVVTSHFPKSTAPTMQEIVEGLIERGVIAQLQKRNRKSSVDSTNAMRSRCGQEVN